MTDMLSLLALIYGQKGTLKTTAALLAPSGLRPITVYDADRGFRMRMVAMSMSPEQRKERGLPADGVFAQGGPHVAEGVQVVEPPERVPGTHTVWEHALRWASEDVPRAKLAVLDTVNSLGVTLRQELTESGYQKRYTVGTGASETTQADKADYQLAQMRIDELLVKLDESAAHVLVLAHERIVTLDVLQGDGSVANIPQYGGPAVVSKAATQKFPNPFDVVLRLEPQEYFDARAGKPGNRVVVRTVDHLHAKCTHYAGDRMGVFSDGEEFDGARMWERFETLIELARAQR